MTRSVRNALLACAAPLIVLAVGLATVSDSQTTTDASGRTTTTTTGLTDVPALIVYGAALVTLAASVLVLNRSRRRDE
jgi:multisubunit Na+/H+ antiporter MnhB subunit